MTWLKKEFFWSLHHNPDSHKIQMKMFEKLICLDIQAHIFPSLQVWYGQSRFPSKTFAEKDSNNKLLFGSTHQIRYSPHIPEKLFILITLDFQNFISQPLQIRLLPSGNQFKT